MWLTYVLYLLFTVFHHKAHKGKDYCLSTDLFLATKKVPGT